MSLLLYRICLTEYADKLVASGKAGRWNREGDQMIYTAGSMALACLENLVHRSGASLQANFSVLTIFVPPGTSVTSISDKKLAPNWEKKPGITRNLGSEWLRKKESAILKVPSAIIQAEHNFLLNPLNPSFGDIKIIFTQPFNFDQRLKQ
jgi:RES domain-containing protein